MQELDKYCVSGVYMIIDKTNVWAYIGYSNFILGALARKLKDEKFENCDVVIEKMDDPVEMRSYASSIVRRLENEGVKVVSRKNFGTYKYRKELSFDGSGEVNIYLVSTRNNKRYIRSFENMELADKWLEDK